MSDYTPIEWTDSTWNPVRGCSRVSAGCENCYAERVAARFSGEGAPYEGLARIGKNGPRWTGKVRMVPGHLADPLRWKRGRKVFVNSMSDLFHEALTNDQIAVVFGVMAATPQHTFQVLTKRAERMRDWFQWISVAAKPGAWCANIANKVIPGLRQRGDFDEWPLHNVWLGVSAEDQATANERIPLLLETPAAVRFVSYEPALGPLDLFGTPEDPGVGFAKKSVHSADGPHGPSEHDVELTPVDWVIVGGESGHGARPFDLAWARSIVEQCKAAGAACFFKQAGARPFEGDEGQRCDGEPHEWAWLKLRDRKGGDLSELPGEWPREFPR
jgi:protein gp37